MKKPNGTYRLCADPRKLRKLRKQNELVEQDSFPIPTISVITDPLRGQRYFSVLDIKDGFRVPLKEDHRHKTTFRVDVKLYQYKVLPVGFRNAPNIFQRLMEIVFGDQIGETCIVYIDDILVFSETVEEHYKALEEILRKAKHYGLMMKEKARKNYFYSENRRGLSRTSTSSAETVRVEEENRVQDGSNA